ncbi:MAG: NAD-dependent epimerase/dehydratase family protein [Candidatus Dormibacteria bacterium]
MRVLLAGGAGFIGFHLAMSLVRRGDDVVIVDNLLTGVEVNLADLRSAGIEFEFILHDVSEPLQISGAVDAVLHFASPASPPDYAAHPFATLDAGTIATRRLASLAKEKGATFMLASTSEIYGDPLEHPQREDYWGNVNSVGPRSMYDEAKRCAEAYTVAFQRAGLDTRIARIFNTYGPRMRPEDGRAIPNFFSQALSGRMLTIYGDGNQTRSLCYIDDLVRGLLLLLESDERRPVNLGAPDEVTVLELAERVARIAGRSTADVELQAPAEDDPQQRCPDITRAREVLGWSPEITLADGLLRTSAWFRGVSER